MFSRTRRLRKTENIRRLVRENKLSVDDLIYPLFIEEGENIENEINSIKDNIEEIKSMLSLLTNNIK